MENFSIKDFLLGAGVGIGGTVLFLYITAIRRARKALKSIRERKEKGK